MLFLPTLLRFLRTPPKSIFSFRAFSLPLRTGLKIFARTLMGISATSLSYSSFLASSSDLASWSSYSWACCASWKPLICSSLSLSSDSRELMWSACFWIIALDVSRLET